jgi:hypothetical protein
MRRRRRDGDGDEYADGARAASEEACKHGKASQDECLSPNPFTALEILQAARRLSMIYAEVRANCGAVLQKSCRGSAVSVCGVGRAGLVVGLPSARSDHQKDAVRPRLHE